jgi:hypothetical protein
MALLDSIPRGFCFRGLNDASWMRSISRDQPLPAKRMFAQLSNKMMLQGNQFYAAAGSTHSSSFSSTTTSNFF